MENSPNIFIVMGSVRKNRLCPDLAEWILTVCRQHFPAGRYEIIDLREWPLPMDDEPGIPAHTGYISEHTQAWSIKVAQADAFIFLTPQYNWGYPAVLKNALDHLYHEWKNKPAMIASYGGHGGGKCATQLQQVLQGLKMKTVPQTLSLSLPKDVIEANSGNIDASVIFADQVINLTNIVGMLFDIFEHPAA